jgi:oligopeptide transport system permease protein
MTDAVAGAPVALDAVSAAGLSPFKASWRRYSRNKLAVGSMVILLMIALACFAGPLLFPYGPEDADFDNISSPINLFSLHPFGTDEFGRDLFLRVLVGGQVSLAVGFVGAFAAVIIGVVYGATSGYLGGRVDLIMMRIVDVLYSLPFIFFVIMLVVFFGRNFILMFIAVGAVEWLDMARIVRGQTLSIKRQEYVQAAEALGVETRGIIRRHVIPNTLGPVVVYMTLLVPKVILLESFLSFLGLGVQEPATSLGVLISEGAKNIQGATWMLLYPSLTLVTILFCLNFIGDGLRDALDPKDR